MNYKRLVISLILPHLAGLIGSVFTAPAIVGWYAELIKPSFSPPNWIFGPVWLSLYTLMGIALYLVWQKGNRGWRVFFIVHLVFNALWSILFFGTQNPMLAFIDIVLLWAMIVILMISAFKLTRPAGYLLAPYFLWVSFAAVLNYSLWMLN